MKKIILTFVSLLCGIGFFVISAPLVNNFILSASFSIPYEVIVFLYFFTLVTTFAFVVFFLRKIITIIYIFIGIFVGLISGSVFSIVVGPYY